MQVARFAIAFLTLSLCAFAQEAEHMHHHDAVNARGEKAMGFSQTATTHHFILLPDGGYIQVQANDPKDAENRDHIRMHLQRQAKNLADGDFSLSEQTHARVLPGTQQMKDFKSPISYKYEEIERGGRLRITSTHPLAIAAIQQFLRFQIEDHQTGDPTTVQGQRTIYHQVNLRRHIPPSPLLFRHVLLKSATYVHGYRDGNRGIPAGNLAHYRTQRAR